MITPEQLVLRKTGIGGVMLRPLLVLVIMQRLSVSTWTKRRMLSKKPQR